MARYKSDQGRVPSISFGYQLGSRREHHCEVSQRQGCELNRFILENFWRNNSYHKTPKILCTKLPKFCAQDPKSFVHGFFTSPKFNCSKLHPNPMGTGAISLLLVCLLFMPCFYPFVVRHMSWDLFFIRNINSKQQQVFCSSRSISVCPENTPGMLRRLLLHQFLSCLFKEPKHMALYPNPKVQEPLQIWQ